MRNSSFFTNTLYPTTSDVIGGPLLPTNVVSSSLKHFGNGGLSLSALSQSGIFTNQQIVWGGSSWVPNMSSSNGTANTFTGINKFIGGLYSDFYQMTGSVIDVTKAGNLYTNTSSTSTVSYSISNPTESYCTFFRINSSSIDRTITIPSTYSVSRGGIITTLYVPAGMILHSKLQYLSARWEIINDPIDFTGSGSLVFNSGSVISLDNAYGLKLTTGVTGFLGVSNGGTNSGTASNAIQSLTTPAQTISASFINWATGSVHKKTLSAHTTFSFNNSVDGQSIKVFVTNTTGNYGVSWPTVSWPGGIVPTQTTGDYTDLYIFKRFGPNFFGRVKQNY